MKKLGDILTIVLVSSSVFVLLDSAKRNFSPGIPLPVVNNAQAVQEKERPMALRPPEPVAGNTQAPREKEPQVQAGVPVPAATGVRVKAPRARGRAAKPGRARPVGNDMRDALKDITVFGNTGGDAEAYVNGSRVKSDPPVSDRAGYLADVKGEKDIFVSRVFSGKAAAIKARAAAVNKLKAKNKPLLFTSLMREAGGGFFYVVRVAPPAVSTARVKPGPGSSGEQLYINTMKEAAARLENECRDVLRDGRN